MKTLCFYDHAVTRDAGATKCESFGMKLADPENHPESLGVLITRANAEFKEVNETAIWVAGELDGKCSVLKWISSWNFEREWVACNETNQAYCEFDSEFKLSWKN
jgi:hypothetical protein